MNTKRMLNPKILSTLIIAIGAATMLTGCGPVTPENFEIGKAESFTILAKSAISTTGVTAITGDVGLSPAAASYLTGFSETQDASNEFSESSYVTGHIYAADYAAPTPDKLIAAVGAMELAFTTANGFPADEIELHAGDLSGKTLTSGVYKWGNNVVINTALTLSGSPTDIWVFQIAGTLTQAADINVILSGGASSANIYWVVSDSVVIGTGSHIEGTILGMTDIVMATSSSINGRLLAQTAVTIDSSTVVKPN